ncbi:MAG: pantoate kinase [Promethearchaeia archaeon]
MTREQSNPNMATAFVPGHVTGFFVIQDDASDPLHCGSMGAGFSVESGIRTTVHLLDSTASRVSIKYNGEPISGVVSKEVVSSMLADKGVEHDVKVTHESPLVIGAGFGASGAGALGTAIAVQKILFESEDIISAGKYAHVAEVKHHTGLGDVIAQTAGGFEIRTKPGAPGIGQTRSIPYRERTHVVLAGSSGLETEKILTDSNHRERINATGQRLVKQIISDPTVDRFVSCSQQFSDAVGLVTSRVQAALSDLKSAGLDRSGMVMLGDSVFCLCEQNWRTARRILEEHWTDEHIIVTSISSHGGRLE